MDWEEERIWVAFSIICKRDSFQGIPHLWVSCWPLWLLFSLKEGEPVIPFQVGDVLHLPWYCGALCSIISHYLETDKMDRQLKFLLKAQADCDISHFLIFSSSSFSAGKPRLILLPQPLPLPSCYLKPKDFWTAPLFLGAAWKAGQDHGANVHCPSSWQGGTDFLLQSLRGGLISSHINCFSTSAKGRP